MVAVLDAIGAPGTPYPTIHPLFAASLETTLPAALPGQVDQSVQPVTGATPFSNVPASRHIMGTHRMALAPERGPCDPYGRYWKFDNLFHAGGGLFVTAPGYNVTLTMWALSYWVAAAIVATGTGANIANPPMTYQSSYSSGDVDKNWTTLTKLLGQFEPDTMIGNLFNTNAYPRKQVGWTS
jgi:choline dehydrogenase-like flavoprotein